ncbi:MAG: LCP family protein [candidate division Zixibacteria bacterium]|nr:LCP family protein [candidate division Zixibacteria bacterium]
MTVLFLGSDASSGNPPYGADSVRLIKVDFDAQKITVVSFPRDMIVQTAALNNASYPQAPLGISFKYASQAASGTALEKNAAAAGIVAQILADDFGAASDHYITVEMSQLSAMIDTLGGVDITIPETITTERGVTFTAGAQTLNGALATEYVRAIQPGGDAARTLRQNEFLKALQAKVISAGTLTKIPALLTQFKDAVATDLSPEQLVNIACLADKVGKDSVTFATVDQPQLMSSTTANVDAIRSFLIQTLGE